MKRMAVFLLLIGMSSGAAAAQSGQAQSRQSYLFDVVLQPEESVRDFWGYFCTVEIRTAARGNTVVIGGDIKIAASVRGNVVAVGGDVILSPGVTVGGDAMAIGGRVIRGENVSIHGRQTEHRFAYVPGQRHPHLPGVLTMTAVVILLGLLSRAVTRLTIAEDVAREVRINLWASMVAGLVVWGGIAVLYSLGSLMEEVNSLLAPVISVVVVLVFLLGFAGLTLEIGRQVIGHRATNMVVISGSVLILILLIIPVVGGVVMCSVLLVAMGSVALARFGDI